MKNYDDIFTMHYSCNAEYQEIRGSLYPQINSMLSHFKEPLHSLGSPVIFINAYFQIY